MNKELLKAFQEGKLAIVNEYSHYPNNHSLKQQESRLIKEAIIFTRAYIKDNNLGMALQSILPINEITGNNNFYCVKRENSEHYLKVSNDEPQINWIHASELMSELEPVIHIYNDPIEIEKEWLSNPVITEDGSDFNTSEAKRIILRMLYDTNDKGKRVLTEVRKYMEESTLF